MPVTTTLLNGPVTVVDYRCDAGPCDRPYVEHHVAWSLAYVRRGSFGCATRGRTFELVPGSVLLGRPGDDFTCTHVHHEGGDECLAFFVAPEIVDEMDARRLWTSGAIAPLPEVLVLGELAEQTARGGNDLGLDEVGLALVARYLGAASGVSPGRSNPSSADRRRAVRSALWIDAHAGEDLNVQTLATRSGLSPFHYLRVFAAVLGVTPHQFLIRCRLRHAARLLDDEDRSITDIALESGFNDVSNFVRSFGRAAGTSPRGYRRAARGDRRIFQERLVRLP